MATARPSPEIATLLARYPQDWDTIRRLADDSERFRETCEHLALARDTLAAFERRPDAGTRPEVGDYRLIVDEFEAELARLIAAGRTRGPQG